MYAGFKFAIIVSSTLLVLLAVIPLVVFLRDFLENPACLSIQSRDVSEFNETHYVVRLAISYCSTIEIKHMEVLIGGTKVNFESVQKGTREVSVVLSRTDVERGIKWLKLNIVGLYELEINIPG